MNISPATRGLLLALAVAACSSETESTAPKTSRPLAAPDAALNNSGVTRSAMGAGSVDLTAANAGFADFQFVAIAKANGEVMGHFSQKRTRNGLNIEFSGRVTCLTTDPNFPGRARIGGVVTENNSTDPAFMTENHRVGADVWFRVTDGQVGGDAADASTTYGFKPTLVNTSAEYCALPFTGLPAWNPGSIFPLARGVIEVHH
jgi:hypothetical protein